MFVGIVLHCEVLLYVVACFILLRLAYRGANVWYCIMLYYVVLKLLHQPFLYYSHLHQKMELHFFPLPVNLFFKTE